MKKVDKTKSFISRPVATPLVALGFALSALCLFAQPLYADDDPFQLDNGHWMSSTHYQDASKRGTLDQPVPAAETPVAEAAATPTTPAAAQTVAAPTRPIDLPVMPGLNKGFDVKVTSTEDESGETPAPVIEKDKSADIHLSDKNWSSPTAPTRAQLDAKTDDDSADAPAPVNVRMSYLPNAAIAPIPSAEHASAVKAAHIALEKSIANKNQPPAKAQEQAACAAIDAYKKQQLDAIQSDRQTLKALQDAISSLGLQKQLGFITGSNSNLSLSGAPDAPTTVR